MTRARRMAIYAIGIGVWLSGVLWLVFHHFISDHGSLGPFVSPFEAWSLTLHGAFAFAAIFVFGLLRGAYVPARWSRAQRRISGGWLAGRNPRLAHRQRLPLLLRRGARSSAPRSRSPIGSSVWSVLWVSSPTGLSAATLCSPRLRAARK
jgi:hypothetical protein